MSTLIAFFAAVICTLVTTPLSIKAFETQIWLDDILKGLPWDTSLPTTSSNLRLKFDQAISNIQKIFNSEPLAATAFDFIPEYIGAVRPQKPLSWTSQSCHHVNNTLVVSNLTQEGALLNLTIRCNPGVYFVSTIQNLVLHDVTGPNVISIPWPAFKSSSDFIWTQRNGIRLLRYNGTMAQFLSSVGATLALFVPELTKEVPDEIAEYNAEFLRSKAFYKLPRRNTTDVIPKEDDVQDGDFFGILRLDGLDPMLGWAMGAHTGHTAIALRFDGKLYICESTASSSYWSVDGIQKTPYQTWIKQAQEASYNVVHLPLSKDSRSRRGAMSTWLESKTMSFLTWCLLGSFNATAARKWFLNIAEGLPYGYHNMVAAMLSLISLFAWIDLAEANYPGTLVSQLHELLTGYVELIDPAIVNLMWGEAFNKRMNTTGIPVVELYNIAAKQNISFTDLFSMPEQDKWQYKDGYSLVCDVLVCETWKAGYLFGDLADDIQCTEFTNWDAYTLEIFDASTRPAACKQADPNLPFCQILGKYQMDLPSFNSRPLLAHMAERCPRGTPPNWDKPVGC
eukprot:gene11099-3165_t